MKDLLKRVAEIERAFGTGGIRRKHQTVRHKNRAYLLEVFDIISVDGVVHGCVFVDEKIHHVRAVGFSVWVVDRKGMK